MLKKILTSAVCALSLAGTAQADTTNVTWWHAMGGALGETLENIADQFNKSQTQYKVTPIYKGTYADTMTSAIAAFRAHKQPDIVQIFEVGTATMMAAKGAVVPLYQLMKDTNNEFQSKDFIAAIRSYYSASKHQMYSMPFNSSTAVVFYNKDKIKEFPKTWQDLGKVLKDLVDKGDECGFTTGYQSWVQIENFAAWNNLPIATENNGFDGLDAKLEINKPGFVEHITQMSDWSKDKRFVYGGRLSASLPMFVSGRCSVYMGSSSSYAAIRGGAKFNFAMAELPYEADQPGAPQNSIIGGASLWTLAGKPKEHYQAVAAFFKFLTSPKIQAQWARETGYLPVTETAYQLLEKEGFYQKHPDLKTPVQQLTNKPPKPYTMGLRLGNMPQIRDIINSELEAVWSGKSSPQKALDAAVSQGNIQLKKFKQIYH